MKKINWVKVLLWIMLITNMISFGIYFLVDLGLSPMLGVGTMLGLSLTNCIALIAILKKKKWGVYTFCVTSILACYTNLNLGIDPFQSITGLFGIVILFAVLHAGHEKYWTKMT